MTTVNGDPKIQVLIRRAIARSGRTPKEIAIQMQTELGLRVPVKNLLAYKRWHPAWEHLFCDAVRDWSLWKAFKWHPDFYRAVMRSRLPLQENAIQELGPEVFEHGWPN